MFAKLCIFVLMFAFAQGINENSDNIYNELLEYSKKDPSTYLQAIVPGTKWCGDGNIAEDYDDLGYFKETDMCCRDHDYCDDTINPGETSHGLVNTGAFTKLNCRCDRNFYNCLKIVDKLASYIVGIGYFNFQINGGECFDEKPPATCVKYETIGGLRERCVEYSYDTSKPVEWQWFDVPKYLN